MYEYLVSYFGLTNDGKNTTGRMFFYLYNPISSKQDILDIEEKIKLNEAFDMKKAIVLNYNLLNSNWSENKE